MELLLNLAWIAVTLALAIFWVRAVRSGDSRVDWRVFFAFALLVVLLFPVISMTDDLAAINNPAETEHIFRRSATHLLQAAPISSPNLLLQLCLLLLTSLLGLFAYTRFVPALPAARRIAGLLKAHGIRPPPPSPSFA